MGFLSLDMDMGFSTIKFKMYVKDPKVDEVILTFVVKNPKIDK